MKRHFLLRGNEIEAVVGKAEYLRERTRHVIEGMEARGFIRFDYGLIEWIREVGGIPVRLPTMLTIVKDGNGTIEPYIEWWCDKKSVKAALTLRALKENR